MENAIEPNFDEMCLIVVRSQLQSNNIFYVQFRLPVGKMFDLQPNLIK